MPTAAFIVICWRYLKRADSSVASESADIDPQAIDSLIDTILEAFEFPLFSPKFWCKQIHFFRRFFEKCLLTTHHRWQSHTREAKSDADAYAFEALWKLLDLRDDCLHKLTIGDSCLDGQGGGVHLLNFLQPRPTHFHHRTQGDVVHMSSVVRK